MAEKEVSVVLRAKDLASNVVAGFQGKLRSLGAEASDLLRNRLVQGIGFAGLLQGVRSSVAAANEFEASLRKLDGTARITGVPLELLQHIAGRAKDEFKLSAVQANDFSVEMAKLATKAGDVGKASPALEAFLDIGAARGLTAAETLKAVQQSILGIDEGTDKLFNANPSVLYKEFADAIGTTAGKLTDAQKAQAILTAALEDGSKVRGSYLDYLNSAAGKQEQLNVAVQEASVEFGLALLPAMMEILPAATVAAGGVGAMVKVVQQYGIALGTLFFSVLDILKGVAGTLWNIVTLDFKGALDTATGTLTTLRDNVASSWQASKELWTGGADSLSGTEADLQAMLLRLRQGGNAAGAAEDEEAAKKRKKRMEDLGEELTLKTVMLEHRLTEAQAKEYIQRERDLGRSIDVQVATVESGRARVDRANILLAAGFNQNLVPAVQRTTQRLQELTHHTEPVTAGFGRLERVTGKTRAEIIALYESGQVFDLETGKWTATVREGALSLEGAAGAGADLASGLGVINDKAAAAVTGVASLGDSIKAALAGGLTGAGVVGIIGGLSGVLKGLFGGKSPAQLQAERELKKNTETIAENSRKVGDLTRLTTAGGKLSSVQGVLGGLDPKLLTNLDRGLGSFKAIAQAELRQALAQSLVGAGLGLGDLDDIAKDLGITIKDSEGQFLAQGLRDLVTMLGKIEPTQFAQTFSGQRDRLAEEARLFNLSETEQAARLIKLAGGSLGSGILGSRLGGLDLSSGAGRAEAIAAIQQLFTDLPGLGASDLGGLTGSQFIEVLQDLKAFLEAEVAPGADVPEGLGTGGGGGGIDTVGALLPTTMEIWQSMDGHLATIAAAYAPSGFDPLDGGTPGTGTAAAPAGARGGVSLMFGDIIVQAGAGVDGEQVGADIVRGINEALGREYRLDLLATGSAERA